MHINLRRFSHPKTMLGLGLLNLLTAVNWAVELWDKYDFLEGKSGVIAAALRFLLNTERGARVLFLIAFISLVIALLFEFQASEHEAAESSAANNLPDKEQKQLEDTPVPIVDETLSQSSEQTKPKFNIECIGAEFVNAWLDASGELHFSRTSPRKCTAAVVEFRRNPDDASESWIEIRTRIELKAPNKRPIVIREGRWVDGKQPHISFSKFEVFDTRRLAIAIIMEGEAYTYEGRFKKAGAYEIYEFFPEFQPLDKLAYEVKVHMYGKSNGKPVMDEVLHFSLYVGSPPGIHQKRGA